jgi:hypothetical protein
VLGGIVGGLTTAGLATAAGISVLVAGPSFLIGGAVAGGLIGLMTARGEERELASREDLPGIGGGASPSQRRLNERGPITSPENFAQKSEMASRL